MNIFDIAKTAGGAILTTLFPAAAPVIGLVNSFLDDDDKIPMNATGEQVQGALGKLPPEKYAEIASKKIDLQIADSNNFVKVQGHLAESDSKGSSTRPKIALIFAWQIVITCNVVCGAVAYSIAMGDKSVVEVLNQVWPIMLAFIGPMTTVIYQYFGKRTQEKKERLHAAMGTQPVQGVLSSLISNFSKK